jgi:hypothetical protein
MGDGQKLKYAVETEIDLRAAVENQVAKGRSKKEIRGIWEERGRRTAYSHTPLRQNSHAKS